jgi:hypothetical protein
MEVKLVHFIVYFLDRITLNSYAKCLIFHYYCKLTNYKNGQIIDKLQEWIRIRIICLYYDVIISDIIAILFHLQRFLYTSLIVQILTI